VTLNTIDVHLKLKEQLHNQESCLLASGEGFKEEILNRNLFEFKTLLVQAMTRKCRWILKVVFVLQSGATPWPIHRGIYWNCQQGLALCNKECSNVHCFNSASVKRYLDCYKASQMIVTKVSLTVKAYLKIKFIFIVGMTILPWSSEFDAILLPICSV
jgi:hypothetical protein